jgi:glycyl-tRNA synthetase
MTLDPVSVELTYGMERIVMALQGVSHFKEIAYAPGVSYGEAFGQAEYEMSSYYLDDADIAANQVLFDTYAAEAEKLIERRRPVPAHTYVLKCSHAFNVLDSRGAISTTERARAFARMRDLAHQVAELWVERREEMGHPLGVATTAAPERATPTTYPQITDESTLAFEIGVEEMPPGEVARATQAVETGLTEKLAASRLEHGAIRTVASPRRVVAIVEDVQPKEPDYERTVRGPRVTAAYDEQGDPTKAAQGFARSQGIDPSELERLTIDGAEHVGIVRAVKGRPAAEVLSEILPEIVTGLRAERNMRWAAPGLSYTRPIRWILAILGDYVVPFSVSTLTSGRATHVDRAAAEPVIEVASAEGYLDALRAHGIEADPERRKEQILTGSAVLAATVEGSIDAAVVPEVTNLVEQPTPILGGFDESYLDLPAEILTTVMKKHQRYLPIRDAATNLLPHFVAVANGDCDQDAVRAGNEAVLRARFEDALFFWRNDLKTPPEAMKQGLAKLTFETRLGSVAERAERIAALATALPAELTQEERSTLARAGQLAKFDLASEMVIELSSLAGVMAREYARRAGEPEAVAEALFEMELPRQAGDALPTTIPGALLALAGRFDLLAGLFAIGSAPKGSSDPFGLRRAALGVIGILLEHERLAGIDIREALREAAERQPVAVDGKALDEAHQFVVRRFEQHQLDAGRPVEIVRAVLPLASNPRRAVRTAGDLARLREDPEFQRVMQAMERVRRILPADTPAAYDPRLFEDPAEKSLHEALSEVSGELGNGVDLPRFATATAPLVGPIDRFFTDVLVMAEDPAVKANRLGLLAAIRDLGEGVLDWTALN